jgi:hypothetical protein
MLKALISALALTALTLSSASASTMTWNLSGSTSQLLGVSDTLISTTGNISMIFNGYITNASDVPSSNGVGTTWSAGSAQATALYSKVGGGDETGLGIAADPTKDNEIFKNSFIQIDISGLLAQKTISALQLVIGSVQSGEGFDIWGSNTAGMPGTLISNGNSSMDDVAFSVPSYGSYRYVSISASADNVLLDTVTATNKTTLSSAPEPSALGLYLIVGIVLISMRSSRKPSGRDN